MMKHPSSCTQVLDRKLHIENQGSSIGLQIDLPMLLAMRIRRYIREYKLLKIPT
jgi:hypothetical protein